MNTSRRIRLAVSSVAVLAALGATSSTAQAADAGHSPTLPSVTTQQTGAAPGDGDTFWTPERVEKALANPVDAPTVRKGQLDKAKPRMDLPDVSASAPSVMPKGEAAPVSGKAGTFAASEIRDSLGVSNATQWPWRATGILFFETPGGAFGHCSAAVIVHDNKSSVWTAAHCLYDLQADAFNTSFAFAPAFANGAPYGYWSAKSVIVPSVYTDDGDLRYSDMGALVLHQHADYGYVQSSVGAYGFEFRSNSPENDNVTSIGYPANGYGRPDSFYEDGMYMRYCRGNTIDASDFNPLDQRLEMDCEMGGGSSGGPMVKDLASDALIVGANSHRYVDDNGEWVDKRLFSSEHGTYAVSVYEAL